MPLLRRVDAASCPLDRVHDASVRNPPQCLRVQASHLPGAVQQIPGGAGSKQPIRRA
jgi:hypothetical protein